MRTYIITPLIGVLVLFMGFGVVSAQTYTSCTNLSRNLSYGMRGNDVTELQRFLVAQNYPGGGSWMITGYFGSATRAAVQNFQRAQGLSPVGIAGPQTRAAIQRVTCSTNAYNYNFSYNYDPSYAYRYGYQYQTQDPYAYNYNYQYGYNYQYQPGYTYPTPPVYPNPVQTAATIYYLSKNAGNVGDTITVYGSGFTSDGNTVHFGNGVITNLRSLDGTTLSFTVPSQLTGYGNETVTLATYQVSVSNKNGYTSGTTPFTVTGYTLQGNAPTISSVTGPNTVNLNQTATWTLTVNSQSGTILTADVTWGDEYQNTYYTAQQVSQQLYSLASQTVSFTHTYTQAGTYTITFRVRNTSGREAQSTMTVYVSPTSTAGNVTLSSVAPQSAQKGTLLTLTGSNFDTANNTVHFGVGGLKNVPSFNNGTTIYYTVPQYMSPCDLVVGVCGAPVTLVETGTYPVYVSNSYGTSQTLNFYVQQ